MEHKTATELEKEYAWASRIAAWYTKQNETTKGMIVGLGGGTIAAGAIIAVGVPSLVVGVAGGAVIRYGLPALSEYLKKYVPEHRRSLYKKLNPFQDFHKDSDTVIVARDELEKRWTAAAQAGLSYNDFRTKHSPIRKEYSKQLRHDTYYRTAAVGVTSFAALGATHFRTDLLDWIKDGINQLLNTETFGEKLAYGERVPQKIARAFSHFLQNVILTTGATLANMSFISEAQARPRGGAEMSSVERRYPQAVPVLEDGGLTEANRQRTITMLDRHLHWLRAVRIKYAGVVGSDMSWLDSTLNDIDNAIEKLTETRKSISAIDKDSGKYKIPLARLPKSSGLKNFTDLVNPAYRAAHAINSLPKYGHVWFSGAVHKISELFSIDFKHKGYDLIPQETARALYELYLAAKNSGLLHNGLTVTEGWNPDEKLTTEHIRGSRHNGGGAVDFGPTGDGRGGHSLDWSKMRDPWYVFQMLKLQQGNEYFDIRFEPGHLDPTGELRAQVKVYLMRWQIFGGAGMTEREAENFLDRHWGNVSQTTNPHFHMNTLAPIGDVPLAPQRV